MKAGAEGDGRGWDSWIVSLTQWTLVWASSGWRWRPRKPGVLQSMGSQRVGHDWETEQHNQRLGHSQWCRVNVFLESPCFLYDPTNVDNLIPGSSAFYKPRFYICKFSDHILLKLSMKDFEHNFISIWKENTCMVVCTFFGIAILWDWNKNWPFPVLWPLLKVH